MDILIIISPRRQYQGWIIFPWDKLHIALTGPRMDKRGGKQIWKLKTTDAGIFKLQVPTRTVFLTLSNTPPPPRKGGITKTIISQEFHAHYKRTHRRSRKSGTCSTTCSSLTQTITCSWRIGGIFDTYANHNYSTLCTRVDTSNLIQQQPPNNFRSKVEQLKFAKPATSPRGTPDAQNMQYLTIVCNTRLILSVVLSLLAAIPKNEKIEQPTHTGPSNIFWK